MRVLCFIAVVLVGGSLFAAEWGDTDRTREIKALKVRVSALEERAPVPGPPGPAGQPSPPPMVEEEPEPAGFPWYLVGGSVVGLLAGLAYGWKKQG